MAHEASAVVTQEQVQQARQALLDELGPLSAEELEHMAVMEELLTRENAHTAGSAQTSSLMAQIQQFAQTSPLSTLAKNVAISPARVGSAAGEAARHAASSAAAFVRRVNANEDFQSTPATIAASVANVGMRNALAVFVPTVIRQFISYGVEAGLTRAGASAAARITLGSMAPILSVGALALGAMRDRMAGTATPTSERSRAIMAATTAAVGMATAATGTMAGAAPLMVAFTAYTAMRDVLVQSRLRMTNANTKGYTPDATHFVGISGGYGLDQALVSLGMFKGASPSGAGAFLNDAGLQVGNALLRGALNWAGEVGEDLMFQSIPAIRSLWGPAEDRHALQLSIRDVGYQQNNVVNAALGPWAVRTGILSQSIGLLSKFAPFPKNEMMSAAFESWVVGGLNGVLYEPFANAGSAQPGPSAARSDDLEAGPR